MTDIQLKSRTLSIQEDDILVLEAQKNPEAFGKLYEKYWESVYRFIYRRISDGDQVKDVAQGVFIKALTNIQKYQSKGFAFSSWLFRIAVSEVSNFVKKEQSLRAVHAKGSELADLLYDDEGGWEIHKESLLKALDSLDDKDLMLIEMRYFEKRRLVEIAEILGISNSNCKVKMHRCMNKLKKLMRDD